jgi:hypothetical protein
MKTFILALIAVFGILSANAQQVLPYMKTGFRQPAIYR